MHFVESCPNYAVLAHLCIRRSQVTVRERDSMTQIRVSIDSLPDLVSVWIAQSLV